jgi:hypothetical protein
MFSSLFTSKRLSREQLLSYIQFNENPINNREKRLHPYISEGLDLIVANLPELAQLVQIREFHNVENSQILASIFDRNGSDKSTRHSYESVYSGILSNFDNPKIIEIGLGSINAFPYAGLNPGGSIKSWRDFKPTAIIIGADIDRDAVLAIKEIGIQVDQTSSESLTNFKMESKRHSSTFDLIIDDGFHDPHANIRTFLNLFELLSEEGYYVIEDVHSSLINFWLLCSVHLPGEMKIFDLRSQRPGVEDNILVIFRKDWNK